MAENRIDQKVIGVAFDATESGEDKVVWDGEFLIADLKELKRSAHPVVIFGITPKDYRSLGMELTPELKKGLPQMVEVILKEIEKSGISVHTGCDFGKIPIKRIESRFSLYSFTGKSSARSVNLAET